MSRLVDADAMIDDCKKYLNKLNPSRDGKECTRIYWLIGVLSNAPTIEPERKTGEWITNLYAFGEDRYECDQCHNTALHCYDFCPNCGADMRGEEE